MKLASVKAGMWFCGAGFLYLFFGTWEYDITDTELLTSASIIASLVGGFVFFKTLHDVLNDERQQGAPSGGTGCE